MMKFSVAQWDKNKGRLLEDIRENLKEYNNCDYKFLVEKVVRFIFNDEDSEYGEGYSYKEITEIDNGDYQGTLLYMIPEDTYQPSESDYLLTYVGYGSCSGCDTLQSIQCWYDFEDEDKEQMIKDFFGLCLNIVQNTIKPFNYGWRGEEKYEQVSE
jgi:hypothetical protein